MKNKMIKKHEILTGVITGILLATLAWAWNLEGRIANVEYTQKAIIKATSSSDIERKDLIKSFNELNLTMREIQTELKYLKNSRKP
jgi:hypothetical protein